MHKRTYDLGFKIRGLGFQGSEAISSGVAFSGVGLGFGNG